MGAYSPYGLENAVDTRNLFFAGSAGWTISALYSMVLIIQVAGRRFDQVQSSEYLLKDAILQAAFSQKPEKYDPEQGRRNLRVSQVESLLTFKEQKSGKRGVFAMKGKNSASTRSVLSNLSRITSSRNLLDASIKSGVESSGRGEVQDFSEEMESSEEYMDDQKVEKMIMEKLSEAQDKRAFLIRS